MTPESIIVEGVESQTCTPGAEDIVFVLLEQTQPLSRRGLVPLLVAAPRSLLRLLECGSHDGGGRVANRVLTSAADPVAGQSPTEEECAGWCLQIAVRLLRVRQPPGNQLRFTPETIGGPWRHNAKVAMVGRLAEMRPVWIPEKHSNSLATESGARKANNNDQQPTP